MMHASVCIKNTAACKRHAPESVWDPAGRLGRRRLPRLPRLPEPPGPLPSAVPPLFPMPAPLPAVKACGRAGGTADANPVCRTPLQEAPWCGAPSWTALPLPFARPSQPPVPELDGGFPAAPPAPPALPPFELVRLVLVAVLCAEVAACGGSMTSISSCHRSIHDTSSNTRLASGLNAVATGCCHTQGTWAEHVCGVWCLSPAGA